MVLRFHLTLPLPVPLAVVSVVHAFFLVALHAVLLLLSPLSVTEAESPPTAAPATALFVREVGDTVMASGTGAGVTTRVSITVRGLTPAAETVMVST